MGDVYWGLHLPLAAAVRRLGVLRCVETGTYFGVGTAQLASLFDHVVSIEASAKLGEFNDRAYRSVLRNVTFIVGDSGTVLPEVLSEVDEPVLIVLDAHWFPAGSAIAGRDAQCPVWGELAAIARAKRLIDMGSVVMIDDADMFLRSLPSEFRDEDFPTLFEIEESLRAMGFEHLFLCDDVLMAGPASLREVEAEYLQTRRLGKPGAKQV